jgi:hypothetical protein
VDQNRRSVEITGRKERMAVISKALKEGGF